MMFRVFRNRIFALFTIAAALGMASCYSMEPTPSGSIASVGISTESGSGLATGRKKTFTYTGSAQSFTVPSGVKLIMMVARGASASKEPGCLGRGRGGLVSAEIPVKPEEKLRVLVGGEGGFNGGGSAASYGLPGGGASDVRENGDRLANRILVAEGGGAAGASSRREIACGGAGGGRIGGTGENQGYSGPNPYAGGGGLGGTQRRGGSGGYGGESIGSPPFPGSPGAPGTRGVGGAGGSGGCYGTKDCSCGYQNGCAGGAGGGGYYGGGGGGGGGAGFMTINGSAGGGGGGGSSYAEPSATKVHFWKNWKSASGDGVVIFTWR